MLLLPLLLLLLLPLLLLLDPLDEAGGDVGGVGDRGWVERVVDDEATVDVAGGLEEGFDGVAVAGVDEVGDGVLVADEDEEKETIFRLFGLTKLVTEVDG